MCTVLRSLLRCHLVTCCPPEGHVSALYVSIIKDAIGLGGLVSKINECKGLSMA